MNRCPHCGASHGAENHFCPVTGQPIDLGPRLISLSLLDRFRIVTILGEGPIGIVVEVEEKGSGRRYAAKLIHPQYTRDASAVEKALEDAKRAGSLDCKHIAEVVKVGRDGGAAISVVRELMTGQCLQDRIEVKKRLPEKEAIKITREILVALDAIHNAGIVDLDLSPADVFLAKSGDEEIVKLVDIGEYHIKQTLILENFEDLDSRNYYAPEQFDTSRQLNPKSDIYAAGAILYHMITGEIPSNKTDSNSLSGDHISTDLAQVIRKALSATPHNRFQSAKDFIEALDNIAAASATPREQQPLASHAKTAPARAGEIRDPVSGSASISTIEESKDELEQPSVIVDMPEMEKGIAVLYLKKFKVGAIAAAILVIVGALILFNSTKDKTLDKIQIVVLIEPDSAAVFIDGSHVEGNPATIEVIPDKKLHTISAKANGFESLERDVKFDVSKKIEFSLIEIIQPDEDKKPSEKPLKIEADSEEQAELPPPPEPEMAQDKPSEDQPQEDIVELPTKTPEQTASQAKPKPKPKPAAKPKPKTKSKPETKKKSREGFTTTNPFG
jgi:serine/threonine protein kinase